MKNFKILSISALLIAGAMSFSSCKKEATPEPTPEPRTATFTYAFNTGQVGAGTAYAGMHPSTLTATLKVTEIDANKSRIDVTLNNAVAGQTYMVHAHDAADPATTPNGTPYNETPNTNVLTLALNATGSSVMGMQEANRSFDNIVNSYNAFFVVHDPMQAISTTDLTTYLVVGVFARN